jgi:hypothetical protein
MTWSKKKDEVVIPPATQVLTPLAPIKPRPLLNAKMQEQSLKQAEMINMRHRLEDLERQATKLRNDVMWLQDHPEAEDVFTPDFISRFVAKTEGKEVHHGLRQEKEEGQGQAGPGSR